jgi:hypothetical protein
VQHAEDHRSMARCLQSLLDSPDMSYPKTTDQSGPWTVVAFLMQAENRESQTR